MSTSVVSPYTAEVVSDALPDRLESFESGCLLHRVDTDALGRAVNNGGKNGDHAISLGDGQAWGRAPHLLGPFGHDCSLTRIGPNRVGLPRRLLAADFTEGETVDNFS